MRGFVPTPVETVDLMVDLLFRVEPPAPRSTVLDPGCGTGAFIDGLGRWCNRRGLALPRITGVEADPRHVAVLRAKHCRSAAVRIQQQDFLEDAGPRYDYIIGNPPYVPITELSRAEKARYRRRFATARGRFDLYLLFFEQALRALGPGGRLVFITPEKFLYVETAGPLRDLLSYMRVEEIRLMPEDTFGDLVTYPTITVVTNAPPAFTRIVRRDGSSVTVHLTSGRGSWLPAIGGAALGEAGAVLEDACVRVSCGVATGADAVFVKRTADLDPLLRRFGHPTVAGRELSPTADEPRSHCSMLVPYDAGGRLLSLERLGPFRTYLLKPDVQARLRARTCVARKPWYAFHETPPLRDILRPKILCKDIGETPHFWLDREGRIVPRHSVYYIVPKDAAQLEALVAYLRSSAAREWLSQNCQRAAKGFIRLQSRTLRRLPLPDYLAAGAVARRSSVGKPVQRALALG